MPLSSILLVVDEELTGINIENKKIYRIKS